MRIKNIGMDRLRLARGHKARESHDVNAEMGQIRASERTRHFCDKEKHAEAEARGQGRSRSVSELTEHFCA